MLIHENIIHKLDYFIENKKIPNIIFYGKDGAGKKYLLYEFINKIYNNNAEHIKNYVMYVNCGFGKGIRFIREDLKFFAKTNIHNCGEIIKIIVLVNADKLTIDAQSALRRCIELFSHSTRFFIVLKNKNDLLNPILSRFCDIYIDYPIINGKPENLHKHLIKKYENTSMVKNRLQYLKTKLQVLDKTNIISILDFVDTIYLKGYNYLDLFEVIKTLKIEPVLKYKLLYNFQNYKKEYRDEKLFMLTILSFLYFRSKLSLENITNI